MNMVKQYLDDIDFHRQFSKQTYKAYEIDIRKFVNFATQFSDQYVLTDKTLSDAWFFHIISKGCSKRTIRRKVACVRLFYKYLEFIGYIQENPFQGNSYKV